MELAECVFFLRWCNCASRIPLRSIRATKLRSIVTAIK